MSTNGLAFMIIAHTEREKMTKLFVVSDIHSFYDEFKAALDDAGFNPNNEQHWLISCGDHFDRGPDPEKIMNYLMSLPRKVLIRGNHEDLLEDCMKRGYAYDNDFHNGTFDTICKLSGIDFRQGFIHCCNLTEEKVRPFLDSMVNYFETENYIFVHSWVPVINEGYYPLYHANPKLFKANPNWRDTDDYDWQDARWGNPLWFAVSGLCPDKTLVVGHWHCSAGWAIEKRLPEFGEHACFDPYYYKDKLIMIDACTAHSGKVNVLVLEDNFLKKPIDRV